MLYLLYFKKPEFLLKVKVKVSFKIAFIGLKFIKNLSISAIILLYNSKLSASKL